ncbi:helix-turn-helix transcriptional regulator [Kineococcus xinjiangensis]|nr:YafY family protein [Kineococcus xinjiangensis]
MGDTGSRTLRLLSLLQGRRWWPGAELAERLGVSVRTLRRDMDRLRELGYPVEAQRGVDGGYQLAPGAALPPLVLDDEEAVALAVGLQSAAQAPVAGTAEASLRALSKVVQVMPARLRRQVEALRAATVSAPWQQAAEPLPVGPLTAVAVACRDAERLRFDYVTADGRSGARHVEPHRLVPLGRRWYLVAYDLERHDWRSFRLDRVEAPRGTGARFAPRQPPAADAAAFVRAGIAALARPIEVEAVVRAPAAVVRQRIGRWAEAEDVAGEAGPACRVRMQADDEGWAVMALGSLGVEFTVVEPPELRARLREVAARLERAAGLSAAPQRTPTGR